EQLRAFEVGRRSTGNAVGPLREDGDVDISVDAVGEAARVRRTDGHGIELGRVTLSRFRAVVRSVQWTAARTRVHRLETSFVAPVSRVRIHGGTVLAAQRG